MSHTMYDALFMSFIACLPRKHVGRALGTLAGWEGSTAISRAAVRLFAQQYQVNLEEAEKPLEAYPNLRSFFTRALKPGARTIDPDPQAVISPVDGIMAEQGVIEGDRCTQVKGRTYSIDELLGGPEAGKPFHHGYFMTIYLSPRHYHRIHTPLEGEVVRYHHLPGHLFPVNGPAVRSVDRLFAVNERLISFLRLGSGQEVAVVKVGAIGVGRIGLSYADASTNRPGQLATECRLEAPVPLARGAELGVFELGSTVILVFPRGLVVPEGIAPGTEVRLGQRVATLTPGG